MQIPGLPSGPLLGYVVKDDGAHIEWLLSVGVIPHDAVAAVEGRPAFRALRATVR